MVVITAPRCFPILANKQGIWSAARGQIYFGCEVDEKLLAIAIEEISDACWVYGSDIPHGDRLHGAVDFFSNETISARRAGESCWLMTEPAFMRCNVGNVIVYACDSPKAKRARVNKKERPGFVLQC
jgi:hypothetical protein